jgi:hypothetical protein
MKRTLKIRRFVAVLLVVAGISAAIIVHPEFQQAPNSPNAAVDSDAIQALEKLEVKGRAPKTGYSRDQFGGGWTSVNGCDTRNIILARDLSNETVDDECRVVSGTLADPYTGKMIMFQRGETTSDDVQIDHLVALSDAWQKGAQQLSGEEREQLANDPLELLAAEGAANQQKGDGDAATWLPARKEFRCQYVARQIAVKQKYRLWVTEAEKRAMQTVLVDCPQQTLPKS